MQELKKDDWMVGGLALLLAIDLLFLPWFSYYVFSASASDAPDGWAGILAVLASLLVLADLLIERLAPQTTVPTLGGSRAATRFRLAVIAAAFVALKFVLNIHFSLFGVGFWVGLILIVALVFVTFRLSQDRPILNLAS